MAGPDAESWGRSTVDTACPLDCPDTCSLAVSVEKGRIVRIDGSARHDVTAGFICGKVRRFGERVYGADRLRHAGLRNGSKGEGQFRHVGWEQALDVVARQMLAIRERWGAEAILPFSYGGSNGLVTQDTADAQLFRRFGASRLARTICAAPTGAANGALYGRMPGVAYADYRHARLIVVWGANPSVSGIHLVPHIRAAMNDGAALVVIDPRRTALARQADIHLAVRPGTDVAVALALHRFLFENGLADEAFLAARTRGADALRARAAEWTLERAAAVADVDAELIERVAELYAETSPAVIRCGWGLERNRNGGSAAAAVLALPAVGGKFGVRGGGFTMSNSGAWPLDPEAWIEADEPDTRLINMNRLGRALTEYRDPPVQMLFVYNANPAVTVPDQNRVLRGLGRDDLFTVVFDQVMTDTARWADVVPAGHDLPGALRHRPQLRGGQPPARAAGHRARRRFAAERRGVRGAGGAAGAARRRARDRSRGADARQRRHAGAGAREPAAARDRRAAVPRAAGAVRGRLSADGRRQGRSVPRGARALRPRRTVRLPGGCPGEGPSPGPPLAGQRKDDHVDPRRAQAPSGGAADPPAGRRRARPRHRRHGARLQCAGEIHCPVMLNADMKPGTVGLPKGLWRKSTMNGSTANALVSDAPTDIGGGACFNDVRVEVTRVVTATLGGRDISIWTTATERTH